MNVGRQVLYATYGGRRPAGGLFTKSDNRGEGYTLALCFEVSVNDDAPVLAGLAEVRVLTAALTFVRERAEVDLQVGGMLERSDHVDWMTRELKRGDVVTIRIVESEQPSQPIARHRTEPSVDAVDERTYYEHLRRKYEADKE